MSNYIHITYHNIIHSQSCIPISVVVVTVPGCSVPGVTVGTSSVVVIGLQTSDP